MNTTSNRSTRALNRSAAWAALFDEVMWTPMPFTAEQMARTAAIVQQRRDLPEPPLVVEEKREASEG